MIDYKLEYEDMAKKVAVKLKPQPLIPKSGCAHQTRVEVVENLRMIVCNICKTTLEIIHLRKKG